MDAKIKTIFRQNKQECSYGIFRNIPVSKPIKCNYNENYIIKEGDNITVVDIMNINSIDISKKFIDKGYNPVVINLVHSDFSGIEIENGTGVDPIFLLRTNFYKTIGNENLYPLKDMETVYSPYLHVFRDMTAVINTGFYISSITAPIINKMKLTDKNMSSNNYISTLKTIETIFQTANRAGHDVIIFPEFKIKDVKDKIKSTKYPPKDLIEIFNTSIMKYAYSFKFIIFSIQDIKISYKFNDTIIKPQDIIVEDDEIEQDIMI